MKINHHALLSILYLIIMAIAVIKMSEHLLMISVIISSIYHAAYLLDKKIKEKSDSNETHARP